MIQTVVDGIDDDGITGDKTIEMSAVVYRARGHDVVGGEAKEAGQTEIEWEHKAYLISMGMRDVAWLAVTATETAFGGKAC